MASYAHTFTSGDTVTPTKLNSARTVTEIVNADISATAAIAGTKIAPNFGSQTISTTNSLGLGGTSPSRRIEIIGASTESAAPSDTGGKSGNILLTTSQGANNDGCALEFGYGAGTYTGKMFAAIKGLGSNGTEGTQGAIAFYNRAATGDSSLTERMRIDASGNVGIGTTSPSTRLVVSGAGFNAGRATFQSTDSGNGITVSGVNGAGINDVAYAEFRDASNSAFIGLTGTNATAGALRFAVGTTSSTPERMRIDASGNVGIGTASPNGDTRLHVVKDGASETAAIRVENPATSGNSVSKLDVFNGRGVQMSLQTFQTQAILNVTSNHPLQLRTNNAERMQIKSAGQVRFTPLSSDPSGAESGDVYYNSSDNKLKVYNGTSWVDLH